MDVSIPLALTLIRLILSPLFIPLLLIYLLPYNNLLLNIFLTAVFAGFSLTDFFDGYLARKYKQETALGCVLDPIADKFLTFSTLIALLTVHKIFFGWVILLVGREFFMMGLRQVALENNFSIHVTPLAKLKTTFLFLSLALIILNPYQQMGVGFAGAKLVNLIEFVLIFTTVLLSLITAKDYFYLFIKQFKHRHAAKHDVSDHNKITQ